MSESETNINNPKQGNPIEFNTTTNVDPEVLPTDPNQRQREIFTDPTERPNFRQNLHTPVVSTFKGLLELAKGAGKITKETQNKISTDKRRLPSLSLIKKLVSLILKRKKKIMYKANKKLKHIEEILEGENIDIGALTQSVIDMLYYLRDILTLYKNTDYYDRDTIDFIAYAYKAINRALDMINSADEIKKIKKKLIDKSLIEILEIQLSHEYITNRIYSMRILEYLIEISEKISNKTSENFIETFMEIIGESNKENLVERLVSPLYVRALPFLQAIESLSLASEASEDDIKHLSTSFLKLLGWRYEFRVRGVFLSILDKLNMLDAINKIEKKYTLQSVLEMIQKAKINISNISNISKEDLEALNLLTAYENLIKQLISKKLKVY